MANLDTNLLDKIKREYRTLYRHYFLTSVIKAKNIVPIYTLQEGFQKILIQYFYLKNYAFSPKTFDDKVIRTIYKDINACFSFYIYDNSTKKPVISNNLNENVVIFNFSCKDIVPIYGDIDNAIIIECHNIYEEYFLRNKSKQFITNHIDEYAKVLACHYYNFLYMSTYKDTKKGNRNIMFRHRFCQYLDTVYRNIGIKYKREFCKNSTDNLLTLKLKDIELHIALNVSNLLKRSSSKKHARSLGSFILLKFLNKSGIKILINPTPCIYNYKDIMTKDELDILSDESFREIRVKRIPYNILPKII